MKTYKYTYRRVVESATYTDTFVSSLPVDIAIRHLQDTWGTCKWTGKKDPDFEILSVELVK